MNILTWFMVLLYGLKRNGILQLFFYLSNMDVARFIEYCKTIEYLHNENPQTILDLGTGYSVLPFLLKKKIVKKATYLTLDTSLGACKFQTNCSNAGTYVIRGDMMYLPIRSSSISGVLAISSIEHVHNHTLAFTEISRVVKRKGFVIISFPYSSANSHISRRRRSRPWLFLLHKFHKRLSTILGHHLNYFLEQTAADTFMKYFSDAEISNLLKKCELSLEQRYCYGKLVHAFFRYVPRGWFVLKDLFIGWVLSRIDSAIIKSDREAHGIILKLKK